MIQIDMQMPENCSECRFETECGYCKAMPDNFCGYTDEVERPNWCPLKEQEAVVHPEPSCEMTYITDCCCDLCGVQLIREDNFCRCCGKRIEWEGR